MQTTSLLPTRLSALFAGFFAPTFVAEATGAATVRPAKLNLSALLTQVDRLPSPELAQFFAGLAVRHQGNEFSTADSCTTALNILSGNVGEAMAPAQAERWALQWLDRLDSNMAGVMRDVRASLADDDGDGQGRFFAARVSDVLLMIGAVDRRAFVAAVLARFQG